MRSRTRTRLGLFLTVALAVQCSGCGLILYPERRGQKNGKIDPTVAILDGIGLLFFIIPGVIAFVVDFHHGTIYLPSALPEIGEAPGGGTPRPAAEKWTAVHLGRDRLDAATIRTVVGTNTGRWIDADDPRLEVEELASVSDLPEALAAFAR